MVFGLALSVPATFAIGVAPTLTWVLIIRAIQGLVTASFAPAVFSYLGSRIEPARRGLAMTILTSSFLTTAVIGQVFAQAVEAWQGWRWFFFVDAVLLAVTAIAAALILAKGSPAAPASGNPFVPLGRLATNQRMLGLLVATLAILGPFMALYTSIQLSDVIPEDALLPLGRAHCPPSSRCRSRTGSSRGSRPPTACSSRSPSPPRPASRSPSYPSRRGRSASACSPSPPRSRSRPRR